LTAIVLYGLRESLRRKMFAVVLVLTLGFLALYAWGAHAAFRDTRGFVGTGNENLDPDALTGAIVQGLAMFATLFLGAVLSVFLTLNVIRGDAEAGLLQPLVVRPVGRARLLIARFVGAAGVAALYVLSVYAATVAIADWAGGWTPDRIVSPGLELAAAVVDDRPKPSVHIGNELPRLQIIHAGQAHHVCHQGAGLSQDHDGRHGVGELEMRAGLTDLEQSVSSSGGKPASLQLTSDESACLSQSADQVVVRRRYLITSPHSDCTPAGQYTKVAAGMVQRLVQIGECTNHR